MGYSYSVPGNRLCCDSCGHDGGVRKRTCPEKIHYADGGALPYCYPSALCPSCYAKHKATLHADCKAGAAKRNAEEVARGARLAGGDFEVRTGYGAWHKAVPVGSVGVRFVGTGGREEFRLLPEAEYAPGEKHWLSDYPTAALWADPDARKVAA